MNEQDILDAIYRKARFSMRGPFGDLMRDYTASVETRVRREMLGRLVELETNRDAWTERCDAAEAKVKALVEALTAVAPAPVVRSILRQVGEGADA